MITDNDEAFASKLRLVESARSSIDMLYFIYHDDPTSSIFSQALLAAAARGVDVRLVVDYNTNYRRLDLYTMMEKEAANGPGSLQVRFYSRPTRRMIKNAVYMTLGCSRVLEEGGGDCDREKFALIEKAFAEETIDGRPVTKNISNLDLAHSGLFLSGLYARRPGAIALAVTEGQGRELAALRESAGDSGEGIEPAKKLARIYWRSRHGPLFSRVVNKIRLALAHALYGSRIDQLKETLTALLPLGENLESGALQDWEYFTDYLHQKLLLVDGERLQLGGRNIGDSYHMRPNPLLEGHPFFADTDLYAELADGQGDAFRQAFERIWSFDLMVASTAEVRRHAPNDFVANHDALTAAAEACDGVPEAEREACRDREFAERALSLEEREAEWRREMSPFAEVYRTQYSPLPPEEAVAAFPVDPRAAVYYLENVPFDKAAPPAERERFYGAKGLEEAESGKYLHLVWRRGLTQACASSSAEEPQRVLMLNPYYLPPGELLQAAGWMSDGSLDCRHVTVQVLTNSFDTNNFKVINTLAHMGLKAFSEFYHRQGDEETRATFDFYEYRAKPEIENFTLHSKVSVLAGDVIVGSANVDARSYMMDANNGVLIRGDGGLRQRLLQFVDAQLADPEVVVRLDETLRSTPLKDLKAAKLEELRGMIAAYGIEERLSPAQQAALDAGFAKLLDEVYETTHAVLRGDEGAIDRYNRLLKLL